MPIIVNTVLNEHQLVLDIVAFVALGDFPRSRLGEKQRGKILAGWVSRKMRTIAQFSIRDPDAEGSVGTAVPEEALVRRGSGQSGMANSHRVGSSSLRQMESLTYLPVPVPEEVPPMPDNDHLTLHTQGRLPTMSRSDDTPTNETPKPLALNTTLDYSPIDQPFTAIHEQPTQQYERRQSDWDDDEYQPYQKETGHGYPDYPSQHADYGPDSPESPVEMPRPLGGLRIANRSSTASSDWGSSALKDLNI